MTVGALPITMAPAGGGKSVATEFGWATPFSCASKTPRGGVATSGFNLSTFVGKSGMTDFGTNWGTVNGASGSLVRSRLTISSTALTHSKFGAGSTTILTWTAIAHSAAYYKLTELNLLTTGMGGTVGTLNTVLATSANNIVYAYSGTSAGIYQWDLQIDLYSDSGGANRVATGRFILESETV